ncbi:MAG: hypothetical protein IK008_00980 [Bacteroidales bacterium]|nr:hypothetical protein [Bacteroidales bacterium]
MRERVKQFLEEAKAKEKEARKRERDIFLISIGLTEDPERTQKLYCDHYDPPYTLWDSEKGQYYYNAPIPLEVTDEEYEELKKYGQYKKAGDASDSLLDPGAEKTLNILNTLMLVTAILGVIVLFYKALNSGLFIYFIAPVGVFITYLAFWAMIKVYINISQNLHEINRKIK